jgi:hypothetical protein
LALDLGSFSNQPEFFFSDASNLTAFLQNLHQRQLAPLLRLASPAANSLETQQKAAVAAAMILGNKEQVRAPFHYLYN